MLRSALAREGTGARTHKHWRLVRVATVTVAALCVAFYMASSVSASRHQYDSVTRGLLCIHHYEGSWQDHGAPYWGGLQMDESFQQTYGYTYAVMRVYGRVIKKVRVSFYQLWGTADHWPIRAQLQAGRNAYRSRGWNPWPTTARYCGLL